MKYTEILSRMKDHPMMGHALGWSDTSRESYLAFVISEGVATDEEMAEFRGFQREAVLAQWAEHVKQKQEAEQKRIEKDKSNIEYHKKQTGLLRRIGEFDFAVKREEYILHLERRLKEDSRLDFSYRSLPGWGDELVREAFSTERTGNTEVDTAAA